eukprot:scaffold294259_cov31-Tisochrysis_lutea.AAC.3
MTVTPWILASSLSTSMTTKAMEESRPDEGSSQNSSEGRVSSSQAMHSRFRSPPEMPRNRDEGVDPSLALCWAQVREAECCGESKSFAHRERGEDLVVLLDERDSSLERRAPALSVYPSIAYLSLGERPAPGERVDQRGLAAARGSHHGEH